ncbi:TLR1 protein, partial [Amia calva]|nr:TLR1 protein [Amia calva]
MSAERENADFEVCIIVAQQRKDLSFQNLTRIPPGLSGNIQYLDLSHNKITGLSSGDLAALYDLCILQFSYNSLEYISPEAFLNNTKLQVLNISYNSLKIIPDLALPHIRVLDISNNMYESYTLRNSFRNLRRLRSLTLGSPHARSIHVNDFAPLQDIYLKQLTLGDGSELQNYESGSFAQLKSVEELTLIMNFCKQLRIFQNILKDLGRVVIESLKLVKFLPEFCNISIDPLEGLKDVRLLSNITFVNTWINSSFMNNIVLNVYKSPVQVVAFLNITYTQDTLEGVWFNGSSGVNHTARLRAVIFNHVLHYQYNYPNIYLNVSLFSQMAYLKFSGTGMNISPCNLISAIPPLEVLDLSNNLLDDFGFWWPTCSYTHVFPALKHLSLSTNKFTNLAFISKKTKEMKLLETLDLSFNSINLGDECDWPSHLTALNLSNNNLGDSVFNYLSPHFRHLDLSKTGVTAINPEALLMLPNLTHLFLSSNSLRVLPPDQWAPRLEVLYVDQNNINVISQGSLKYLSALMQLQIGNNPFSCTCDLYWFVTAFDKTLLLDWPTGYTCSSPPDLAAKLLTDFHPERISCDMWLQSSVAIPVTFAIVVVFSLAFYCCDGAWYLKMLWVWIRVKRRSYRGAKRLGKATFHYHAFISYSQEDSAWVHSQLVTNLENEAFSLCIHERDFVPGDWIIDNIINSVECSYKTLFVLSQNFVRSEWCNYELFFAQHRAISVQQNSLVFILLEPIPTDSLPKKFLKLRTLLGKQTYLEWPKEERKQLLFWASLKSTLKTADKHIILKDVSKAIIDSCSLLVFNE